MFHLSSLLAYMAACSVIILIPGPAQALVLSNCIGNGKKSGITTAIGLNLATVFHSIAAALGLSAILATSAEAFSAVKFAGAAYLIYMGITTLVKNDKSEISLNKNETSSKIFTRAFVTGLLNPKVAIFFLAFLPQFVDTANGYVFIQFLVLGTILGIMDVIYESILAIIADHASRWFVNNKRFTKWRTRITGSVLVGLGIKLAFVQKD
jgi:threonine/homoserine/homoserine lactone efflux protein